MEKEVYVNRNTGEEVTIEGTETVKGFPDDITVLMLSNGTRWSERSFHFAYVPKRGVVQPQKGDNHE